MDPNSNPQEYLDQISAKRPGRFAFIDKKILILVCAVILLIIAAIIWFALSASPKQSTASETLAVRLQNMVTLLDYDSSKITDNKTKKAIAETKVIFASDNYQLSQAVALPTTAGVSTSESIDSTISLLDKASSSNNLAKEYSSALDAQLNQIINSLEEMQIASSSPHIELVLSDLAELSSRLSGN